MNDKKICFIYCINDRTLFEESKRYVQSLEVPAGFEVEILDVEQASSMTAGYNFAMQTSDAKYKVYLHQDVFIINKQFLVQLVELFSKNPEVGMLGMVGAKTLPANAIWWESTELYGKVYDSHTGKMDLMVFQEVEGDYQEVEAVDGLLMATQYDLPWREDLFDGWHYYDVSQSMEFINKGYKVAIPRQEIPWVLHDCGVPGVQNYFYYKSLFIHHYEWNVADYLKLPMVSILIPTYNRPYLFELALRSALAQTYPNVEVIVCDDSTNDETEKVIQKYLNSFKHLVYVKNEKNLGQFQNDLKLFDMANGEYVNYLMDDDLFHPEKIEKMMKYYLADHNKEITLVTSHRLVIDDHGNFYPEVGIAKRLFPEDTIMKGIEFGDFVLGVNANFIGEPTTVLFRKADLKVPFGTYFGREYGCNVDMATWINLLAKGKIVYISETLSYFRYHSGQQQQSLKMEILGIADYAHELLYAPIQGFFKNIDKYVKALNFCSTLSRNLLSRVGNISTLQGFDEFTEYNHRIEEKIIELTNQRETPSVQLPLISILIPYYDSPFDFNNRLELLSKQTYKNIELIADSRYEHKKVDNQDIKTKFVEEDINLPLSKMILQATGQYLYVLQKEIVLKENNIENKVEAFINFNQEEPSVIASINIESECKYNGTNKSFSDYILYEDIKDEDYFVDWIGNKKHLESLVYGSVFGLYFQNRNYMITLSSLLTKGGEIVLKGNDFYKSSLESSETRWEENKQKEAKDVIEFVQKILISPIFGQSQNELLYLEAILKCHDKLLNLIYESGENAEIVDSLIRYEKHIRHLVKRLILVEKMTS